MEILTPQELYDTKSYLQNINKETIADLAVSEFKQHIRDAVRVLMIERDNFGYTIEELMFYTPLRFRTLTDPKSKNYIKDRINEAIKETPYISVESSLVFGKRQNKFLVRTPN